MGRVRAIVEYGTEYLREYPEGSRKDARDWLEATGLAARTAAELARMGWTPATVAARMEAAPVRWEDERDAEDAVDAMLFGGGGTPS